MGQVRRRRGAYGNFKVVDSSLSGPPVGGESSSLRVPWSVQMIRDESFASLPEMSE